VLVFRLRSSTTAPPPPKTKQEEEDSNTTVFAVASLEATESVATAHERDMVQWREMVEDGRYVNGSAGGSASGGSEEPCRSIAPADGILELKDHRPNKTHVVAEQRSPAGPISNRSSSHKAKAVTAASFFASQKKKQQKSSSSSKSSSETLAPTKADTNQPSKKGAVSSKQEAPVVPKPTREKENKVRKNRGVAPISTTTTATKKVIGNADDFVADEEDSEDDDVEVVLPKSSKVRTKPTPPPSPEPQEPASPVRGAMDAFTTTTTTTTTTKTKTNRQTAQTNSTEPDGCGTTRQRKRRKKLVEKTSLVNGYLRNETQVVWEDVPTDEEEEEKAPSAISRNHHKIAKKAAVPGTSKNPQGMKQKSLMGFFSKKK
jgi:hypothetical protein